ncbi:sulfonate transport system ATP-binding protein [Solibacillus kalamii]|uniref:Sulfonate ABC transporter ATP-binding protein n=1 Tax=Solibacillus kalamii TaxID=1748298 RepID=A0ABX3ZH49_9BACL|nr:ABC transporter ATP-binding protein [Solibacillus kalamii]MBM7665752.1 sulfonate transport system ATP-binding protein [Solibacillus kalamii]OUZ38800.1 sulfonate ABC transporter ATP-binding protein [Solibacillus kalamii]
MEHALTIQSLNKIFSTQTEEVIALKDVNLQIEQGEFITVIGPSGCGKSTLLKIIAGLDTTYEGIVELDRQPIKGPSLEKGFIFQEPRLFPWLTVEKNIAGDQSLKNPSVRKKVDELIQLVKLEGFETAYPKQLSGGMAQRVSIARALLRNPKVLLLDEPFGALDAFTRSHMQEVLLDIWTKNKTTMIFVTHDLDEAVFLGQRVVIMNPRPGHIKAVLPIELTFPRKRSSLSFQEMRRKVLNEFERVEDESYTVGAGI